MNPLKHVWNKEGFRPLRGKTHTFSKIRNFGVPSYHHLKIWQNYKFEFVHIPHVFERRMEKNSPKLD